MKVFNDLRLSNDTNNATILILVDLNSAFDTIDHKKFMQQLKNWVNISDTTLNWFHKDISGRIRYIKKWYICGIPEGSILGPLHFSLYMPTLGNIIYELAVNFHRNTDDTQLFISAAPDDAIALNPLISCLKKPDVQ